MKTLTTLGEIAGVLLIAAGAALIFVPAGLIVAGVGAVLVCELLDKGEDGVSAAEVAQMIARAQR
jgi:uncharacterized membrane protein